MDDKKIMKDFIARIGELNKHKNLWIIFQISGIAQLIISGRHSLLVKGGGIPIPSLIVAGGLIFMSTVLYIQKYTVMSMGSFEKERSQLLFLIAGRRMADKQEKLSDIVKTHGFDLGIYYGYLLEKILIVQGVSCSIVFIAAMIGSMDMKSALVSVGMIALISLNVWYWKMLISGAAARHKKGLLYEIFYRIVIYIEIMGSFVLLFFFINALSVQLSSIIQVTVIKNINNLNEPVKTIYHEGSVGIADLLFSPIITLLCADIFGLFIKQDRVKIFLFAALCVFTIVIAVMRGMTISNERVSFSENSVSVKHDDDEKEYGLKDIKLYRISLEKDYYHIHLEFNDGRTEEIYTVSSVETDAWKEKYSGETEYFNEFAQKLEALGIKAGEEPS